ncbi:hypothetical protein IT575_00390 [bacterium]|nr:hypothetical protein [bacterium]
MGLPELASIKGRSDINKADVYAPVASIGTLNTQTGLSLSPSTVNPEEGDSATAYAIYNLPIDASTVAVVVRMSSDYKVPNYVVMGDYQNLRWDFGIGKYYGTFTILLDTLPGGRQRWINSENMLTLGLVMHGNTGRNSINALEIVRTADVTDLSATIDRYDGIKLSWTLPEDLDAIKVERRAASSSDPWELLTPESLDYLTVKYMDTSAQPPLPYEYRVSTGLMVTTATGQVACWSPGVTTTGQRSGIVVDGGLNKPTSYIPANLYKYMSFFYQTEDTPSEVQAIKSDSYPPANGWAFLDSTAGIGTSELSGIEGLGLPFNLHQNEMVNAPFTTLGFSKADGTYMQLITATQSGLVSFDEPFKMLPADSHFFGFVELPRSLGAVYWDETQQQLEMLQSWDEIGTDWRQENEMPASWHVIDTRKPDGPIYMESKIAEPHISYRDAATGALVCKFLSGSWQDEAPVGLKGFRPEIRQVMSESLLPGKALFWIPEDRSSVDMLIQSFPGDWMPETHVQLNAANAGEAGEITEFDVYTGGVPSWDNYLVFIQGGHAYLLHSGASNLSAWSSPILIDGGGTCSNLKLIVVGSADDFSFKLFATYLLEDGLGHSQICFRDMGVLKQESIPST